MDGVSGPRGPREGQNQICARHQGLLGTRSSKEKLLVFFFSNLKSGENDGTCQELFDSEN